MKKRIIPVLLACMMCSTTALAGNENISIPDNLEQVDTREVGSIEIKLTDVKKGSKENVEFTYAKVADIEDGEFTLHKELSGTNVNFNEITYAKDLEKAAKILEKEKLKDGVVKTNKDGIANVEDLSVGVYLVYATDCKNYEIVEPTLISIPTWGETEGEMMYDVKVMPKHTPFPVPEVPKTGDEQNMLFILGTGMMCFFTGLIFFVLSRKKK